MAYDAKDIADWFIVEANRQNSTDTESTRRAADKKQERPEVITHLKLQKILYFAQAAHLAINKKKLFRDKIHAWDLGPVVANVYQEFKSKRLIDVPKGDGYKKIDKDTQAFLKDIWSIFGKFSAGKLVDLTHEHRPWQDAHRADRGEIEPKVLQEFYTGIFQKA